MTMKVNGTQGVAAEYLQQSDLTKARKAGNKLIFQQADDIRNKLLRVRKYNALRTVYTDKKEYKAALEKAMAEGTYNPEAPAFIYADKKTVKNYQELGRATGQQIVNEDGTINTSAYKYAMRIISGDFDIDKTELKYAKDRYDLSLTKSELKKLARPLGIEISKTNYTKENLKNIARATAEASAQATAKANTQAEEMAGIKLDRSKTNYTKENLKNIARATAEASAQATAKANTQAEEMAGIKLDSFAAKYDKSITFQTTYQEIRSLAKQKGISNTQLVKIIITEQPENGRMTTKDMLQILNSLKAIPDKKESNTPQGILGGVNESMQTIVGTLKEAGVDTTTKGLDEFVKHVQEFNEANQE